MIKTENQQENKNKQLWFRRTAGVLTFIVLLVSGPIIITSAPESSNVIVPTWIVGMLAAGSLSVSKG